MYIYLYMLLFSAEVLLRILIQFVAVWSEISFINIFQCNLVIVLVRWSSSLYLLLAAMLVWRKMN